MLKLSECNNQHLNHGRSSRWNSNHHERDGQLQYGHRRQHPKLSGGTGSLASGWYQVITFTNSTTIVLDRAIGAGVTITMNIGGALSTIAQAITNKVQGNTIYVKATGAYTVTTTQNLVAGDGGTGDTATTFIGYTSARTDNGQATWTTATNSVDLITFAVANNFAFYNFAFTNTAGTKGNGITAGTSGANGNLQLYNCLFDGFNIAVNGPFVGSYPGSRFSWSIALSRIRSAMESSTATTW